MSLGDWTQATSGSGDWPGRNRNPLGRGLLDEGPMLSLNSMCVVAVRLSRVYGDRPRRTGCLSASQWSNMTMTTMDRRPPHTNGGNVPVRHLHC